jgi:hypothetical protein
MHERFFKFVKNKFITIIDINVQQMVQRKEIVDEIVKTKSLCFWWHIITNQTEIS